MCDSEPALEDRDFGTLGSSGGWWVVGPVCPAPVELSDRVTRSAQQQHS